jgi:hypothetical protein
MGACKEGGHGCMQGGRPWVHARREAMGACKEGGHGCMQGGRPCETRLTRYLSEAHRAYELVVHHDVACCVNVAIK